MGIGSRGAIGLSFFAGFNALQNAHLNAEYSYSSCDTIPSAEKERFFFIEMSEFYTEKKRLFYVETNAQLQPKIVTIVAMAFFTNHSIAIARPIVDKKIDDFLEHAFLILIDNGKWRMLVVWPAVY